MESSGVGRGAGSLEASRWPPFRPAEAKRSLRPSLGRWKAIHSCANTLPETAVSNRIEHRGRFLEPGFPER